MFKHPLRIKNQTSVKKSERKLLFDQLATLFPVFSIRENQTVLFPDGEDIKVLKVEVTNTKNTTDTKNTKNTTDTNNTKDFTLPDTFLIYCNAKKQPLFISFDVASFEATKKTFRTVFLPTVYALWQCNALFALQFATVPEVIGKLQNGADLMLAGVTVLDETRSYIANVESDKFFPYAGVTVVGSEVPVAVGLVVMELKELQSKLALGGELKGRLLKTVHVVGDELWALGDKTLPPSRGSTSVGVGAGVEVGVGVEEEACPAGTASGFPSAGDGLAVAVGGLSFVSNASDAVGTEESMDALFRKTLLVTLKSKISDGKLPVLASTLNGQMMLIGRRISGQSLDVKQTSYKKFGKFLDDMAADGVLSLSKVKEGVQAITSVAWKHPAFADIEILPDEPSEGGPSVKIPSAIRQVYIVNGKTASLFTAVNPEMKKGYEFRTTDGMREVVSQYIKSKNLTSKTDSKIINLDQVLMDIVLNKSVKFQGEWPMKWGEVFDKIIKEMSVNHEVVFTNGGSVELKGKLIPMDVKVEKKSGNKLVTVIRNLEGLGMEPEEIAKELQQVVGATVGVREEGGVQNTARTVTVQGDQTKLLDKFFFQSLSMPKKFVTGLEKPGKKG